MPFCNVLKELQRQKASPIIRQNGDLQAISPSVEALKQAAAVGNFDEVRQLCLKSVPIAPDSSGYTPLHIAATEGHVEVVRLLLKSGAQIDAQDDIHGNTALHEAAWKGYSHTVEVLCKHKANLHLKNKGGFSPLHLVCQQGHNQSCRVLLLHGCEPDLKNNYGDSPLHTAARYGHAGVVRILISAFCNINDVNKNGDSSLHISSAMGRRKLTKILLEHGCDPALKNKQGETAMDIALRKSFKEVQDILANPPPLVDRESCSKSNKRGKESSLGSKDSSTKLKERHKKKSKSGKNVHFFGTTNYPHNSPYGCPLYPDMTDFPKPKLDSLPPEPLRKGEQYFVDLAGNIRKGPVGKSFNCYCVPIFKKVERKMEKDKEELKEHIHHCHDNLNEKITSLEQKTSDQLVNLHQTVAQKMVAERMECIERNNRRSLRDKLEFERRQQQQVEQLKGEMRSWLETKLSTPPNHQRIFKPNPYFQNSVQNSVHFKSSKNCENESVVRYDRPKSCLGISHRHPIINQKTEAELSIPCRIARSKSEIHLTASDEEGGRNDKSNSGHHEYGKEQHLYANDFNHSEIHAKEAVLNEHDPQKTHQQATDVHHNERQEVSAKSTNDTVHYVSSDDQVTDLMKSLRCNGSNLISN
ncbi:ankyrin repeat domain-containing protein 6-like protein, partial [Dinothrombium tinctorium]